MMMKAVAGSLRPHAVAVWRDQRGAAAVEFALVMPILVLLLFGIVEFARVWNVRQTMTDAAREGARVAAVSNGMIATATLQDSVVKIVRTTAFNAGMDTSKLTVTHTGIGSGRTARVVLAYSYHPIMGLVLPGPITLNTSSVMRNE